MTSNQFDALVNMIEILIDKHSCRPGYIDGYHGQQVAVTKKIMVDQSSGAAVKPLSHIDKAVDELVNEFKNYNQNTFPQIIRTALERGYRISQLDAMESDYR